MSLNKLFNQCDDYLKKIDQKIRMEDYKRTESTEKNLSDLKILFGDFKKIVSFLIKILIKNKFIYRKIK
jgi:hypothetical protein